MNSPADWLLVVKYEDGTKGYINLWQAIEEGRITVKMNPLNHCHAVDACADCAENRHDIDTNFGADNTQQAVVSNEPEWVNLAKAGKKMDAIKAHLSLHPDGGLKESYDVVGELLRSLIRK